MPDTQIIRTRVTQIIGEIGLPEACRRLAVRREVLLRLASGAGVREGSLMLVAARLGLLAPTAAMASPPSFGA